MKSVGRGNRQYIRGIDGLRTIAVLGVIIYHLLPNVLKGGYLGVPIFLILSGYLVTNKIFQTLLKERTIDLVRFYKRRFARLYPVLISMLVMTTAYITLFARPLLHQIKSTIITNLLWVYNWWEIGHGQSYFDQFNGISPFTHLWTLGVEAQFYIIWPLLFVGLFLLLRSVTRVRWAIVVLAILSAVEMALLFDPRNINRVYYGTDTRAFSLLLGCWLGMSWDRNDLRGDLVQSDRKILNMIGAIALAITLLGFVSLDGQSSSAYRGGMFLYSVTTVILLAMVLHPGSDWDKWMTNPFFSWVGKRSYGIYVYQYPVMAFYQQRVNIGIHPVLHALVQVVIIAGVSELSYRLIEVPIKNYDWSKLKTEFTDYRSISLHRGMKLGLGALVCLIALFGMVQPDHGPAKDVVKAQIEKNDKTMQENNKKIAEGKVKAKKPGKLASKYGLTNAQVKKLSKIKITAVGDSVMADASRSVQEVMPQAYVDAKVGRQGADTPAVLSSLKKQGYLNKIVVLNLGTNGPMTKDVIDKILDEIGPNRQVYWLTPHVPTRSWQQTVIKQIKSTAKHHKNVHVINWYGESLNHKNWFAGDNVHMNEKGNVRYAKLVAKAILKDK
ncbi:MAG: acyltransferase family protein [Limosilactobacillus sp.]|uniref:acyltransferase family protein n=1 Tax=Limosilactobacillus sp. TaxID=2773925 RepID=UPI0026F9A430|nr:acyltransferase family protein [Limosilactobacillus sp.]